MANDKQVLLEVKNLTRYFPMGRGGRVHTVGHVNFRPERGEILGLVGESGCGKSMAVWTIIHIYEPTGGCIIFDGQGISHLSERGLHPVWKHTQMIFQDPYTSPNMRVMIRDILAEPLFVHELMKSKEEVGESVYPMLEEVGLAREHVNRYTHEFSGGQRQRVGITGALILEPELVICGGPISALDVSIQTQIINPFRGYQEESRITYLFIAHDLSMIRYISDEVDVMYLRQLVGLYETEGIYVHPPHPYTRGSSGTIPVTSLEFARRKVRSNIEGDIPNSIHLPSTHRFHMRCPFVAEKCKKEEPVLKDMDGGHLCVCHLYD